MLCIVSCIQASSMRWYTASANVDCPRQGRRAVDAMESLSSHAQKPGTAMTMNNKPTPAVASLPGNLQDLLPQLEKLYTDIHAHPELSLQETRTAKLAAEHLRAAGYEVTTGIGKTGVVGLLRNGDGPTVMLRADMDACRSRRRPAWRTRARSARSITRATRCQSCTPVATTCTSPGWSVQRR
jgi:hypothetical protein